jgi:integrase
MRSLQWLRDCALDIDAHGVVVGGSVTLQREFSKNKKSYTLPLKGELLEVIRRAWANREPECPYVFHNGKRPIADFRKSWAAARKAAGLDMTLVHDMRRSCARNLVRAGVSERVAMSVTGHATRSMFDRYCIMSSSDLEQAMTSVSQYITAKEAEPVKSNVIQLRKTA